MAYAKVNEVQDFLRAYSLPDEFLDPKKIQTFLDIAKSTIDTTCKRDFDFHQDVVEFYHGSGRDYLQLYFYPVVSISHVIMFNQLLQAMRVFLDTELIVFAERGQIYLPPVYPAFLADKPYGAIFGNVFIQGRYNVEVKYSYGYQTPPDGIKTASIKLAASELLRAYIFAISSGRSSFGFGGTSENYVGVVGPLIEQFRKEAEASIQPFRHWFYRGHN